MSAIATTTAAPMTYAELERLASNIAKSGLFGIKTPDQAMVLMMIAHAEGRHPVMAARDYDIIQGRPAKKAEAMARDFLEAGGKIEWTTLNDDTADATFSHPRGGSVRIIWDMDRATLAGLNGKDTWKKFPRQMLRSRTVSEGVRTIWPSATSGMYVPEEAADAPPFTGPTIEHTSPTKEGQTDADLRRRADITAEILAQAKEPPATSGNGKTRHSIAPPAGAPDEAWRACLDKVGPALSKLSRLALVEEMADGPTCSDIVANGPGWARAELAQLLADNVARFRAEAEAQSAAEPTSDDDELAIAGEEKLGAG